MWYVPPWQQRPPRRQPRPEHVPAAIGMLAKAKYSDDALPLGGFAGEMLTGEATEPGIVFGPGLQMESPPWADGGLPPPPEAPAPRVSPITSMLQANEEFDPPPLGPPDRSFVPLRPVELPPPDWRLEETLRAERDRLERGLVEHPRSLEKRPA